jgi:3-oxoacid CoA-transferase
LIQSGGIPIRLGPAAEGKEEPVVLQPGRPRETRIFDGKTYVMETALKGDVAILRAWKVDEAGNCQFRYEATYSHVPVGIAG